MGYVAQMGTYAPATDTFTVLVDCNDGQTFELDLVQGLEMPHPGLATYTASHARANGIRVSHTQYDERDITLRLVAGPAASYASLQTALQKLLLAQETVRVVRTAAQLGLGSSPRLALLLQPPGSATPVYADVLAMAQDIGNVGDTQAWVRLWQHGITLELTCASFLGGKPVTIQNWVTNPGLEAPASNTVPVFNDTLANFNAYAVTGSALSQDTSRYNDAVMALSPLRYFRLDEASGTVAYEASGTGFNGVITGVGVTYGVTGGLTGDNDTAMTFNGTSGRIVSPGVGSLPTGTAAYSVSLLFKIAANPGAAAIPYAMGTIAANEYMQLIVNTDGTLQANTDVITAKTAALTTNVWHHVVITYDGAGTLALSLDGNAAITQGGSSPNMTYPTNALSIGAQNGASGNSWFPGSVDEVAVYGTKLSSTQITALYNASHNTPSSASNTMSIPASTRVSFGSPSWGAVRSWQVRFRATTTFACTFYLHYTNANNYLALNLTSTAAALVQVVGGTTHTLASTSSINLVNEIQYWIQFTQFPGTGTIPPLMQCFLCYDALGSIGAAFATLGQAATFDAVTAVMGQPSIANGGSSAALGISTNVVNLFGPGGWAFSNSGTGPAAGAWEQNTANTYPNGPVSSYSAGRIDAPPSGAWTAQWAAGNTSTATNIKATGSPVSAPGNVLGVALWVVGSGLAVTCTLSLSVAEYDSTGTLLRTTATGQSITGPASSWTQLLTTSYTAGANCAYVVLLLIATDATSGSANGTVWLDNAQCWNVTTTGAASMPYAELCFANSPAQLVVSGLTGDVPAPCRVDIGTLPAGGGLAAGSSLAIYAGRRAQSGAKARLVSTPYVSSPDGSNDSMAIDPSAGGGYRASFASGSGNYAPLYISGQVSDLLGVYHLFTRLREADANPTIQNLQADVYLVPSIWLATGRASYLADYHAPFTMPWVAQNTWTLIDAGQIAIPPAPLGASGDATQIYATAFVQSTTLTTGMDADMGALLPVDAEVLVASYLNETLGSTITGWVWCYFDGLAQMATGQTSATWSQETSGLPNPSHAAGAPGTLASGSPSLLSIGDSYAVVDPLLTTNTGQVNSGVNQWVVVVSDSASDYLPVRCQLTYRPQYLQVR